MPKDEFLLPLFWRGFLFLIFYSYSVAPFLQLADEVGGGGDVVCEDDAGFFPFPEGIFLLAVVQRQGAQIVSYLLCATDGKVSDGIGLIVMPNAEAITEVCIQIYFGIGNKSLWHDFKSQCSV